jgi:hypothetical protein
MVTHIDLHMITVTVRVSNTGKEADMAKDSRQGYGKHLNVELLPALAASEGLLAFRVLAAVVAAKLVQADERLLALRAPRRDLLVVARLQGARQRRQRARLTRRAAVAVVRLVVHLHRLRVLERLVAPFVLAPERPPVLYQVHRDHRRFNAVLRL